MHVSAFWSLYISLNTDPKPIQRNITHKCNIIIDVHFPAICNDVDYDWFLQNAPPLITAVPYKHGLPVGTYLKYVWMFVKLILKIFVET